MGYTYEIAAGLIENYILTRLDVSSLRFNPKWFAERSYAKWAATELRLKIMNYYYDTACDFSKRYICDVYELIDSFIDQMNLMLTIKYSRAFVIATDTAIAIKGYLENYKFI